MTYFTDPNRKYTPTDNEQQMVKNELTRLEGILFNGEFPQLFKRFNVYFITLNPRINASLWKHDIKLLTKKWTKTPFAHTLYNFEFSTCDKTKYRLHSHGLIFLPKRVKSCALSNKWILSNKGMMMKILGDKQKIDIIPVKTLTNLQRYIKYITGGKKDAKQRDVIEDKRIRREMFKPPLKDYYSYEGARHNQPSLWRFMASSLPSPTTITFV